MTVAVCGVRCEVFPLLADLTTATPPRHHTALLARAQLLGGGGAAETDSISLPSLPLAFLHKVKMVGGDIGDMWGPIVVKHLPGFWGLFVRLAWA